jgi:hypothetical protein
MFHDFSIYYHCHAMAQATGYWFMTVRAWVQSQGSQCEICVGQSSIGTGVSPSISVSLCQSFQSLLDGNSSFIILHIIIIIIRDRDLRPQLQETQYLLTFIIATTTPKNFGVF